MYRTCSLRQLHIASPRSSPVSLSDALTRHLDRERKTLMNISNKRFYTLVFALIFGGIQLAAAADTSSTTTSTTSNAPMVAPDAQTQASAQPNLSQLANKVKTACQSDIKK